MRGGSELFSSLSPEQGQPAGIRSSDLRFESIFLGFDLRLPARFFGAVAKYHQAIGQTNYPLRYVIQTVANGGPGGVILVVPAENWAALAPPDKTLPQVLVEAYGEAEAGEIMQQFGTSIRSQTSAILRVRPDLSGN